MIYTEKVMDHFNNPRNVGELPDANGVGEVGNAKCGDIMKMYLKIEDGIIKDVKFKTYGCGSAIATCFHRDRDDQGTAGFQERWSCPTKPWWRRSAAFRHIRSTARFWLSRRSRRPSPTTTPGRESTRRRLSARPASASTARPARDTRNFKIKQIEKRSGGICQKRFPFLWQRRLPGAFCFYTDKG